MSKAKAVRRLENRGGNARDQNAMSQATKHQIERMAQSGRLLSALIPARKLR